MKKITYILASVLISISALTLTSCTRDELISVPDNPGGSKVAEITMLLDMPSDINVSTKAETGSVAENGIEDIYILVFDESSEKLISKSKGKNLAIVSGSDNNNRVSFKATLPVGTEYTYMVLANVGDKLDGIEVNSTTEKEKSDLLALTVSQSDKWNATNPVIPMWAEQDLTLTASSSPVFELTRMLARINLEVNLTEETPAVPRDNFKLTSIRYYNYNTAGALVPVVDNYDPFSKYILRPTLPAAPGTQTGNALLYTGTDIIDEKSCREKIYIFEAAHNNKTYNNPADNDEWINNPCLVIGGKYKTDNDTWLNETFYRIDFIRKDATDPNNVKDVWLSILRNFSYNVTITAVNGGGFSEPKIALKSAPINMEANILDCNEREMGEIVFDGTFFLSVSKDRFEVGSAPVNVELEQHILYIKTDYVFNNDPTHTSSGWHVEKYVDKETDEPVTWLQLNPDRAAPDADNKVKTYFTFEENTTDSPRTAIVWIAAGRLRYPVEVTQRLGWIEIVDPLNGNIPLTELRFEVPIGGSVAETKPFKVNWGPSNEPVNIEQHSPRDWAPFDPINLNPNPANSSWTLTGDGSHEYLVTAPQVDASLIEQDPFYEKESIYSFTVGTGQNAETASISLHQIHYNIAVDMNTYRLDGKTYYLTVRSNTEWIITDVEEWLSNLSPSGSSTPPILLNLRSTDNLRIDNSGGPNMEGENVFFTTVNQHEEAHKDKWGTIWVTFASPTDKFDPVRIPIRFAPWSDEVTILGLANSVDHRAYNPTIPYAGHLQALNRMITSKYNFGTLPESTVQGGNFNLIGYNCIDQSTTGDGGETPYENWKKGYLKKWLNEHNPDIILIAYALVLDQNEEDLILRYLDNGGVVIMHYGEGTLPIRAYVKRFIEKLFGITLTVDISNATMRQHDDASYGAVYQLPDGIEFQNDPILNGPFGDWRSGYYGMNRIYNSFNFPQEIQDKIIDYTGTLVNKNYTHNKTTVFRLKDKKLFFIANGGGTGSYYPQRGAMYPYFDVNRNDEKEFRPVLREGFGPSAGQKYDVCNGFIYLNALTWAMNVTNHVPPAGGY